MKRLSAKKAPTLMLVLAVVSVGVIFFQYAILIRNALSGRGVSPTWSDESGYHVNARYVAENSSTATAVLIDELESPIGHFGSHGPAYNIIDGFIYKLFGTSKDTKIFSNLILLVMSLLAIASVPKISPERRCALLLVPLTSFALVIYLFSHMQELLNICVACLMWALFQHLSYMHRKPYQLALLFILITLVATIRPTWAILSIIPLGFHNLRRTEAAVVCVAAMIVLAVTAATFPLIHVTYPLRRLEGSLGPMLNNRDYFGAYAAIKAHALSNLANFFRSDGNYPASYHTNKIFFCVVCGVFTLWSVVRRSRVSLVANLFYSLVFVALISLYEASYWQEQRYLAAPFVYLGLTLVSFASSAIVLLFLLASVHVWYVTLPYSQSLIGTKRWEPYNHVVFEQVRSTITGGTPQTVLAATSILEFPSVFTMLPVRSHDGSPIRYTFNASYPPLTRHRRLPIRYAIARRSEAAAAGITVDSTHNDYVLLDLDALEK